MLIPGTVAAALAGLLFGLSLIVAIGAQNTYVIRQGIARAHVPTVVTICAVSDVILIAAGVAGLGAVVGHARGLLLTVRLLGVAFLLGYAALAARRALRPGPGTADGAAATSTWRAVAAACLAFTWLNPAVYLDTVVLLGSIANTHGPSGRWLFAVGASVASILWFSGLGFGARFAAPLLTTPRAWQVLDLLIAATMLTIAAKLAF